MTEEQSATPLPDPVIDTSTGTRDGVDRCPKCGSTEIQLRVSTGRLICLFCRHEWSEEQIEERVAGDVPLDQLTGTTVASGATDITDDADTVTLKCQGCGAEVVVALATATSTRCHWCRHVLSLNEQVPNGVVPDAVLPFSITQADAVARIKKFAGSRRMFAERRFVREFTPENVLGVYLPYLVVDGNVSADVQGVGEIQTRRYTRKQGESTVTYYDADIYRVARHVDFTVDDLTLESSADRANLNTRVNTNNIINTILPFDTKNAVEWNAHYLVGYTSERRDRDVSAMEPMFEDHLLSIARSQVESSIGRYDRGVRWEGEAVTVHGSRWVAMYLPVWLYSYYHGSGESAMVHYIAVNGRTGETMGSVPVSHGRLLLAALTTGTVLEGIVLALLAAR
ncbi:TFIIB-type zinc ribbon-containing protein [Nocardioides sp.]|uniref:TFIIB-type zinc ribbon-containing protein n=1 Tax=Nocardioides sp. TaxID=35761 RepID=UPI00261F331F|nr:TFIIB-type zinc ribbon-containing protein [Nocardioides sp.]